LYTITVKKNCNWHVAGFLVCLYLVVHAIGPVRYNRVPFEMNEILPGLWLGSHPFKDAPNLIRVGIKSILTLDLTPLPVDAFKTFDKKFIYLIDEPGQDVLGILEDALMFIETSIQKGGVLVHCFTVLVAMPNWVHSTGVFFSVYDFLYVTGEPCVCGTWVTPAFHFKHKHIDRINHHSTGSTSVSPVSYCPTDRSANST
ncbi:uncharacterized protein DEA37_0001324, partial [Paragonimus westermani]